MSASTADEVSISGWIKARNAEIASLAAECEVKLPQQMSQRLPRYMRRRAASGNPKRIPKCVRPWWLQEKKKVIKKRKPKHTSAGIAMRSRKKRNEDASRSCVHIWFAKRFRIKLIWNQKVAWSNNTKNQRSLFRKSKSDCTIYYLSNFMRCIRKDMSDEDASEKFTSPIHFTHNGDELMFVHVCETVGSQSRDASDLYQLVRLVGAKAKDIADSLPRDKCLLLTGHIDEAHPYVDVISIDGQFKPFIWPLLSKNKSHLVGGIRDWCMLHLNCGKACFPFFGYPSSPHATSFAAYCGKKGEAPENEESSIVRSQSSLVKPPSSDHILVPVLLTASGRGTPIEGDEIVVPCDNGKSVIGSIQFGAYCMQSGCGKAIGTVCIRSTDKFATPFPMQVEFRSTSTLQNNCYRAVIDKLKERSA